MRKIQLNPTGRGGIIIEKSEIDINHNPDRGGIICHSAKTYDNNGKIPNEKI